MKFGAVTQFDPLDRNIWNLKYSRWRPPPCWRIEKCHISAVVRSTLTKFGITTQLNLNSSDRQKFKILKINYGCGRHFEKSKNRHISPRFEQFRQNSARWRSPTLFTALTVKDFAFQKFKMAADTILKHPNMLSLAMVREISTKCSKHHDAVDSLAHCARKVWNFEYSTWRRMPS